MVLSGHLGISGCVGVERGDRSSGGGINDDWRIGDACNNKQFAMAAAAAVVATVITIVAAAVVIAMIVL